MIRPRYFPDSFVAQLVSVSAFLHSLDPKETLVSNLTQGSPLTRFLVAEPLLFQAATCFKVSDDGHSFEVDAPTTKEGDERCRSNLSARKKPSLPPSIVS